MVDRTRSSSKGAVLPLIAVSTGKWTRSSPGGTLQETPVKLLRQTRARKESRLEGILNELSVDVMEDIVVNDGAPASSLIPSESLHHLCRKICRPETQSISCYFEFGKALKDRLDGLIEKRFVNARETLNKEVLRNFPAGTSLNFAKRKMEKARKIYDLFSVIGVSKIQRIRSFSADAISSLTKDEIGYIKGKFS
ncbi:15939_t:CDS:1 [Acaulospora colombiana]|uniref:15939_t:CDS:1 n=1 Tax=Acaulospora colombiana TaxID=27376 RepID=A0ACA9LEK8_9GLOM|nr:15939_t:CDS:1 [Acaulospora colombiana]